MIVRVFRARVHPGKQAEFEIKVRELSIPLVKAQRGLLAFYSGGPLESSPEKFVMVTVWESLAHLKAFCRRRLESFCYSRSGAPPPGRKLRSSL